MTEAEKAAEPEGAEDRARAESQAWEVFESAAKDAAAKQAEAEAAWKELAEARSRCDQADEDRQKADHALGKARAALDAVMAERNRLDMREPTEEEERAVPGFLGEVLSKRIVP